MPILGVDEKARQHLLSVGTLVSPRPKSVLVVTAHWEADPVRVSAHPAPDLMFGAVVVSHAILHAACRLLWLSRGGVHLQVPSTRVTRAGKAR